MHMTELLQDWDNATNLSNEVEVSLLSEEYKQYYVFEFSSLSPHLAVAISKDAHRNFSGIRLEQKHPLEDDSASLKHSSLEVLNPLIWLHSELSQPT